MRNVIAMMRSMLTPMRPAVSASCATARMPLPVRVWLTKKSRKPRSTIAATTVRMILLLTCTTPIENTCSVRSRFGNCNALAP